MAYQVLARKYRPTLFSDVVGQDHVTRTLLNALAQNRIAHGYIFSGHRGIGKTTIARILASALNCRSEVGSAKRPTPEPCNACESCLEIRQSNAVDVIEIDAATNRGIEDVRELRDAARYQPARDRFKIIILDEAHQITDAAFNALLKTLEEPPDHIVFMFATTQPEDIPQTIRSRCQHFSFHAVKLDDIVGQLTKISLDENILVDNATLSLLAEAGDGSMRDALSIMDQAIASAPLVDGKPALELDQVRELMGSVSNVIYEQVLEAVHANNSADVLNIINRLLDAGNGAPQIARQFVRYLRNTVVAKITALGPDAEATGIAADLLQISPEERRRAARSSALFTEEDLSRFLSIMLRTFDELGYRQEQRFHLELGLLKLVHAQRLIPIEDLLSQLGTTAPVTPNTKPTALSSAPTPSLSTASAAPTRTAPPAPAPKPGPVMSATHTPISQAATPAPTAIAPAVVSAPAAPSPTISSSAKVGLQDAFGKPATSTPTAPTPITAGALAIATEPIAKPEAITKPEPTERPHLVPTPIPAAEVAPQAAPEPVILASVAASATDAETGDPAINALQSAIVEALAATAGQETASHQIEDATFTLNVNTVEIQTTVSKAMLPVIINATATKILTTVLREQNPAWSFTLLPGTPASAGSSNKAKRPAKAGSIDALAENHPLVQEAKRLFSAEISKVHDLRDN